MPRPTLALPLLALALTARAAPDDLERGFATPGEGTRPRCYWYWLDGHISKAGITADLEAMKRIGIGEAYIGMIDGQSGIAADPTLRPLSDAWWDTMAHAIREGTRLGVDIGVFNSPGWSQSGGPWVAPGQSMRYLALPEVRVHGPRRLDEKLPAPAGLFQDVAVTAFPAPEGDAADAGTATRAGPVVTIEFPAPITARSVTVRPTGALRVPAELAASDDGRAYRPVKRFEVDRHQLDVNVGFVPLAPVVESIPGTRARFFRITFAHEAAVGEVRVSPAARVERFMEKQLAKVFQDPQPAFDSYVWPAPREADGPGLAVAPGTVLDLSGKMDPDGTLHWDVPEGDWVILRAGMRPTGSTNGPAPAEATGLEVDKMSRAHLADHFDRYLGELIRRVPEDQRRSWKHVVADSYERGPQNWTDGFLSLFRSRYGYDPAPYFPALTGRIVGSADRSERFLWDLRRLVADRVATEYVGGLHDLCAAHGMRMWLENYGHFGFPSEFLLYGGACDEISGEFWVSGILGTIELRAASSAAHTYGKTPVWAEAFTGGPLFVNSPRDLKARGDWALCQGINQFTLHLVIHQPDDRAPGMSAVFGSEFNRHNTWFEMSGSWIDYQRRCTHMLQQGVQVADIAYFIGGDAPKMTGLCEPPVPAGFDFDFINADVLLTRAQVQDGRLTLPDGMSYRVLVLPPGTTMRPEVMEKIAGFAEQGLAVHGPLPDRSPSLEGYPSADARVRRAADRARDRVRQGPDLRPALATPPDIAGLPEGGVLFTHRRSAEAEIYFLSNQADTPAAITPAFRVRGMACELWDPATGGIRRVAAEASGDATRVPLRLDPHGSVFVVFRGTSPRPLPAPGAAEARLTVRRAVYEAEDGAGSADVTERLRGLTAGGVLRTPITNEAMGGDPALEHVKRLRVEYEIDGSPASTTRREGEWLSIVPGRPIPGPWRVDFPGRSETLPTLTSWTESPDPAVKYFSGTATYRTTFPATAITPRTILDLGRVDALAEVTLNGARFPALWKYPYELDITAALRDGENTLEVRVANVWHNRLVGRAREPALSDPKIWASAVPAYGPNEPLLPSGLLGPVILRESP